MNLAEMTSGGKEVRSRGSWTCEHLSFAFKLSLLLPKIANLVDLEGSLGATSIFYACLVASMKHDRPLPSRSLYRLDLPEACMKKINDIILSF